MQTKETQLQQMLSQLRTRLLVMFAAVGIALEEALLALESANKGKAQAVIDGDDLINAKENEIDELALSILVRNQPVAHDLRFVVAALRMVSELERIGDEAVDIATLTCRMDCSPSPKMFSTLAPLVSNARDIYSQVQELFKNPSAVKALELSRGDVDSTQLEFTVLQTIMTELSREGGENCKHTNLVSCSSTQGILIARALSRVCGRAINLAEQIYFIEQGVNIKHLPAEAVQSSV